MTKRTGFLKSASEPPPAPAPPPKPKLGGNNAALAGLFPTVGPAIYGAVKSEEGDKLSNALKLGGGSFAGSLPGGLLAQRSMRGGKYSALQHILGSILAMAGSSYATRATADHIDKKAFDLGAMKQRAQVGAGNIASSIGNLQINPLNPVSGALTGGAGGALVGGAGGLLKALLDSEDDGIMGALRKALGGAAVGGAAGAALGGGYSSLQRQKLLNQTPEKHHGAIREIMNGYTVPLKAEWSKMMGKGRAPYAGDIGKINRRAAFSHLVAPPLVNALEQKAQGA